MPFSLWLRMRRSWNGRQPLVSNVGRNRDLRLPRPWQEYFRPVRHDDDRYTTQTSVAAVVNTSDMSEWRAT
jgi:hypothetical protein